MNIIISGKIGSGKSFAATVIESNFGNVSRYAFADKVKEIAIYIYYQYWNNSGPTKADYDKYRQSLFVKNKECSLYFYERESLLRAIQSACVEFCIDIKHAQTLLPLIESVTTPRIMAQRIGTDWGRKTIDQDIWVDLLEQQISEDKPDSLVIDDLRFPNEYEWFEKTFKDSISLRTETDRPATSKQTGHDSEQYWESIPFDIAVKNDFSSKFAFNLVKQIRHQKQLDLSLE